MHSTRWLTIALLLCLLPACGFGSDDGGPTTSGTVSRSEPTPRPGQTATTVADRVPAATILSGHTGAVSFVAWSPDGALLATAAGGLSSGDVTPRIWDAAGAPVAELSGVAASVTGLSWSADSSLLAAGGADGVVRLWNRDGTPSTTIAVSDDDPPAPVAAVAWSPDGALLATAVVQMPDPATPGPFTTLPAAVRLWQADGTEVRSFEIEHTFRGNVYLAWSDDGSRLAAGGNDLHVWNTSGNVLLSISAGEFDIVAAMAFAPDGATLAYVGAASQIQVQPVDGGTPSYVQGFSGVQSLVFSPDSASLAVTTDGELSVLPTDNPVVAPTPIVITGVHDVPAWSPDSARLAIGTPGRSIRVASVDGSQQADLTGCDGFVSALDWSADGAMLAAGMDDGRVCFWDVTTT